MQKLLSDKQIEAFHHDNFVEEQVGDFLRLLGPGDQGRGTVVDMGGGVGHFARRLAGAANRVVRVVDADAASVDACKRAGVPAVLGDALAPTVFGDEDTVCFNLILHHLVGSTEALTRQLQSQALDVWRGRVRRVFVNEYIYESYLGTFSGWLIFQITSSRFLSTLASAVARVIPAFQANTFGVGVRFRDHDEWVRLFGAVGYRVKGSTKGADEDVSPALRLLLIRTIRRDSFLLAPSADGPS
jgi:hypothetical protein